LKNILSTLFLCTRLDVGYKHDCTRLLERSQFRMPRRLASYRALSLIIVVSVLLAGCEGAAPSPTPITGPQATATQPTKAPPAASSTLAPAALSGALSFLVFGEPA